MPHNVTTGVPQGSILGPLLFIIFFNDLHEEVRKCYVLQYADDTVIFYGSKCPDSIENGTVILRQLQNIVKKMNC